MPVLFLLDCALPAERFSLGDALVLRALAPREDELAFPFVALPLADRLLEEREDAALDSEAFLARPFAALPRRELLELRDREEDAREEEELRASSKSRMRACLAMRFALVRARVSINGSFAP